LGAPSVLPPTAPLFSCVSPLTTGNRQHCDPRSGFYKELVDFVAKKQNGHGVDAETIRKEFVSRQINGRGINAARVARYIRYAVNHG